MEFKKAARTQARLRAALCSPAGGGKTFSALKIAAGLGGRIAMIDTEHGSGSLYADTSGMPQYDVLELAPPFSPARYIEAIHAAEKGGFAVIIVDSLSHAWAGEGGVLDMHEMARAASKSGNSWTAWREVTPQHALLVEAMLQSPCHIIATMRSKQEYAQVQEEGKATVKKLGLAPVQREGMDYEFAIVFDLSMEHIATASKDRTGLFDGQHFKPAEETGRKILAWLSSAKAPAGVVAGTVKAPAPAPAPPQPRPTPKVAPTPIVHAQKVVGTLVDVSLPTPLMPSVIVSEDDLFEKMEREGPVIPVPDDVGQRQALRDALEKRWPGSSANQKSYLIYYYKVETVEQVPADRLQEAIRKLKPPERPQAKQKAE